MKNRCSVTHPSCMMWLKLLPEGNMINYNIMDWRWYCWIMEQMSMPEVDAWSCCTACFNWVMGGDSMIQNGPFWRIWENSWKKGESPMELSSAKDQRHSNFKNGNLSLHVQAHPERWDRRRNQFPRERNSSTKTRQYNPVVTSAAPPVSRSTWPRFGTTYSTSFHRCPVVAS